jgi:undecaprenyl-phosphate galactose phosphotransferase/putative colanic acid biosynthesis UDP-glucose lipid carrier transferase
MSYISEAPRGADIGLRHSARWYFHQNIWATVAIVDFILIVAASIASGVAYHRVALGATGDVAGFAGIGANGALLFILLGKSMGMYRPTTRGLSRQWRDVFIAWVAVLVSITALLFLLKVGESYSRGAIAGFGIFGLTLLLVWRAALTRSVQAAIAHGTIAGPSAIVLGDTRELAHYPKNDLLSAYGIHEVRRFELPQGDLKESSVFAESVSLLNAAINAARTEQAETMLAALNWSDKARYDLVRDTLRALPLPVVLLPDRSTRSILSQPMVEMGSEFAVELQRTPLTTAELVFKRAFDIVVASGLLLLLSPLLLLVSVAIKLDSKGPVIFRQHRKGFNGRPFAIYKFRTMTVCENGTSIRQAQKDDDRVTPLGALLRTTSIDELPQLINVLQGHMSLVGPRPHAVAHDDEYSKLIANYAARHNVKPGITGFAQVKGFRGETARLELMERRVDHDLWYIDNWSMWLDIWILLRTCIVVPQRLNAR